MKTDNQTILENVKLHQNRLKLSGSALAACIGVTERTISRWRNGGRIKPKHFDKLATAFGIDIDTLCLPNDKYENSDATQDKDEIELYPFSCRVSQHAASGFSLIKSKFGLSKSEVVEWAPALFYLVASQAIEDLQNWVDKYDEKVREAPKGFAPDEDYFLDYQNKIKMLEARDVFGKLFGRTFDEARIPFIDAFIKISEAQRNELSPEYFGDRNLEAHLPRAKVLLDLEMCQKIARGDEALASAIQDCSIYGLSTDDSDESFKNIQSTFEAFCDHQRKFQHNRRHEFEKEKRRLSDFTAEQIRKTNDDESVDYDAEGSLSNTQGIFISERSIFGYGQLRPTRAWEVKLWRELDETYGAYQPEEWNDD